MTRYGAVLNFGGPFPDGDGIDDLTARVSKDTRVLREAYAAFGPKVCNKLFFQHSSRLNEQATVNSFVGHAHALIIGILTLQPSGNLFRRPIQNQFTRNDLLQPHMTDQKARLWPQSRLPGFGICFGGSGYGKWFHGTHACSHRRDTDSSAIGKPVPATNPESVYSMAEESV